VRAHEDRTGKEEPRVWDAACISGRNLFRLLVGNFLGGRNGDCEKEIHRGGYALRLVCRFHRHDSQEPEGVKSAHVDYDSRSAEIEYDDILVGLAQMNHALEGLGYQLEERA
jgi:hypothetical protein